MNDIRISAWAVRNPVPVSLLFIALMIAGMVSYTMLPIKQFPDIDFPGVAVTVVQQGAAPTELENQVTRPIEDAIASISNIDILQSVVTQGVSTTVVQFQMDQDVQKATDDVQQQVDQIRAELPREIEAPIVQRIEVTEQPIITYAVSAPQMSSEQLSWFIDNELSRALQGVNGVARISRIGGVEREINVVLDPVRMAALGVTAPQVNAALVQTSADIGGGRVSVGGREQSLRVLGAATTADEVRQLTIPVAGRTVRVGDVADVGDGAAELRRFSRLDGRPVVGFQVFKTVEASDVAVEDRVDAKLADLFTDKPHSRMERMMGAQGESNPADYPNISTNKIYSFVYETRDGYHATQATLFEGMLLASLVVFVFLRDWRATLITAVAMPTSLIPTFLVMALLGFSLNIVTLLALTLVIGILIDDAIVEIENIEKRIHRGERPYQAALIGADQIGLAVIATTFSIFVVFLPVSFMPGIPGKFFKEFGLTVCIAVMFSLIVARLLTPLLAAYFLAPKQPRPRPPLPRFYDASLRWALDHRILASIIGGLTFIGALGLMVVIPKGLVPEGNPDFYIVDVQTPPGSSLEDTFTAAEATADIVAARPETEHVFVNVGAGAIDPNQGGSSGPTGVNRATITAVVTSGDRPTNPVIRDQMIDDLATVPDARVNFASSSFGSGGVSVILTSESGDGLEEAARTLQRQMRDIDYLVDPRFSTPPAGPEIIIRPKPDEAARLGVTAQTIAQIARIATVGDIDANVAKVTAGERRVPIRVRLPKESRNDLATLRALQIPTAGGGLTTLENVADIQFQAGPAQIDRIDRKRQVTVRADVTGGVQFGDAQAAANALPILQDLPPGVEIAVAGEQQANNQLFAGFIMAIFSGIFLVYGVMVLLFRSFFKPIIILSALPLALSGAVIGLLAMGLQLDMPSLIGFLMLMGLAAKNSILLVEYAIERERDGMSQREAIHEACHERARPIVMTSFAMSAGMLPTAIGLGAGFEFRQPMAVAVIGGLVTSTVLSLVIVPVVYEIVGGVERWAKPKFARLTTPREHPEGQSVSPPNA
jgi:HAE1 family hydrophobic/amphiphilic exporter-1